MSKGRFYINLGIIYFYLQQYKNAIKAYEKSFNYNYLKADNLGNIGEAYFYLQDYEKAKEYFSKALKYVDKNNKQLLSFIYGYLHEIYAKLGEWKKAYKAALKYHDVDLAYKEQFYKINIAKIKQNLEYEHQKMLDSLQHVRELEVKKLQIQREKEKAHDASRCYWLCQG